MFEVPVMWLHLHNGWHNLLVGLFISSSKTTPFLSLLAHENPGQVFPLPSHIALKWPAKTGHEWMFERVIKKEKRNLCYFSHTFQKIHRIHTCQNKKVHFVMILPCIRHWQSGRMSFQRPQNTWAHKNPRHIYSLPWLNLCLNWKLLPIPRSRPTFKLALIICDQAQHSPGHH